MNANENMPYNYSCEYCHYKCSKKSSWSQHIITSKHKKAYLALNNANEEKLGFLCDLCGKNFKHQSSYCRHKRICSICHTSTKNDIVTKNEPTLDKDLILMLIKQNNELMEIVKNQSYNITTNTNNINTNCNNKTFNLQLFLNETCKDAMNITDFVDSIKLQLSDLEDVGRLGYIEGISNIIIKNLNNLDETKRPLHCTDKKRETIYIKDQGQWEKEDDNKSKIKRLISKVSSKNSRLLTEYREKYPDCKKCDSKISDKFNKMVIEAMGGPGDNNKEKEERIIRNITKATTISSKNVEM